MPAASPPIPGFITIGWRSVPGTCHHAYLPACLFYGHFAFSAGCSVAVRGLFCAYILPCCSLRRALRCRATDATRTAVFVATLRAATIRPELPPALRHLVYRAVNLPPDVRPLPRIFCSNYATTNALPPAWRSLMNRDVTARRASPDYSPNAYHRFLCSRFLARAPISLRGRQSARTNAADAAASSVRGSNRDAEFVPFPHRRWDMRRDTYCVARQHLLSVV